VLRESVNIQDKVHGPEGALTLLSVSILALAVGDQGKYEEAERMHWRVLEGYVKLLGEEHSATLASINNLASIIGDQGRHEEAERMHR